MNSAAGLTLIAAMLLAPPAIAAEPAPSEHRLSPEQIEAVLADAARKRESAEGRFKLDPLGSAPKGQVHGEVGVSLGSGGYREVYGTGVYPLGEEGAAAISFDYVDLGRRRRKN